MKRCILVLLLLIPVATGQTPGQIDIDDVQVIGMPEWVNGAAEDARIQTTLVNRGNTVTSYTLTYYWDRVAQDSYLNGEHHNSVDVSREPLPPGEKVVHEANWRVQDHHRGDGRIIAVLETSVGNGDVHESVVHVPVHSVRIEWASADPEIRFDETRFFRFTIHNEGTVAHDVLATLEGSHPRLQAHLDTDQWTILPGGAGRGALWVDLPFTGDDRPLEATFHLAVTAGPVVAQSDALVLRSTTAAYDVDAYGVATQYGGHANPIVDGSTVLPFTIRNEGTRDDSYSLHAVAGGECDDPSDGRWMVVVQPPRTALRPGEATTAELTVQAEGALPGTVTTLRFCAVSDHAFVPVADASVSVAKDGPRVQVAIDLPEQAYLGDPVPFQVTLRNHGTQASPSGSLKFYPDESKTPVPAIDPGATFTADTDVPALEPGAMFTADLEATWSTGGLITATTQWVPDDAAAAAPHEDVASIFIATAGLSVAAPDPLEGVPGQKVAYLHGDHAFKIRNDGTARERVTLEISTDHGTVQLVSPGVLILDPGEERIVPVVHQLPVPHPPGPVQVRLNAELEQRPSVSATATVETQAVDGGPPDVRILDAPPAWDPRNELHIQGIAWDEALLAAAWLHVVTPDGMENHTLAAGAWSWNGTVQPGTLELQAGASDTAGHITWTPVYVVEVGTFPAPVMNATALDAQVQITAHDPRGIREVSLSAGQVLANESFRLGETHVNVTLDPGLPPGHHEVVVRVTSWTGRINETPIMIEVPRPSEPTVSVQDRGAPLPWVLAPLALALARRWQ